MDQTPASRRTSPPPAARGMPCRPRTFGHVGWGRLRGAQSASQPAPTKHRATKRSVEVAGGPPRSTTSCNLLQAPPCQGGSGYATSNPRVYVCSVCAFCGFVWATFYYRGKPICGVAPSSPIPATAPEGLHIASLGLGPAALPQSKNLKSVCVLCVWG